METIEEILATNPLKITEKELERGIQNLRFEIIKNIKFKDDDKFLLASSILTEKNGKKEELLGYVFIKIEDWERLEE